MVGMGKVIKLGVYGFDDFGVVMVGVYNCDICCKVDVVGVFDILYFRVFGFGGINLCLYINVVCDGCVVLFGDFSV